MYIKLNVSNIWKVSAVLFFKFNRLLVAEGPTILWIIEFLFLSEFNTRNESSISYKDKFSDLNLNDIKQKTMRATKKRSVLSMFIVSDTNR